MKENAPPIIERSNAQHSPIQQLAIAGTQSGTSFLQISLSIVVTQAIVKDILKTMFHTLHIGWLLIAEGFNRRRTNHSAKFRGDRIRPSGLLPTLQPNGLAWRTQNAGHQG